jgi:type VI secretion system protein ImpE
MNLLKMISDKNRALHSRVISDSLLKESIAAAIAEMESRVATTPANLEARLVLFQCLCIDGSWSRAVKQLQVCAQLNPDMHNLAQAYRQLLRSENLRTEILQGHCPPTFFNTTPNWGPHWITALQHQENGATALADAARETAFSLIRDTPGECDLGRFTWMTDGDTRLGPACELVFNGQYLWLPFAQILEISLSQPTSLLELIWLPTRIRLRNNISISGFIPARYPISASTPDALKLGNQTQWEKIGTTCILGAGQKIWNTDACDLPLFSIRSCKFDVLNNS